MLSGMQVTCECWDGLQGLEVLTNLTELILSVRQDLPEVPGPLRQLTQLRRLTLLETGEKETIHDLDEEVRSLAQVPTELAGLFFLCSELPSDQQHCDHLVTSSAATDWIVLLQVHIKHMHRLYFASKRGQGFGLLTFEQAFFVTLNPNRGMFTCRFSSSARTDIFSCGACL